MNAFTKLVSVLSGWVWGPPMLILLVGTGLYLTVRLKGLQFRALPLAFRLIWHKDHGHGDISHLQALMTAMVMTGAMIKLETVWNFSDLMNGMMAIPNLIALLVLSKVIKEETDRYFKSIK